MALSAGTASGHIAKGGGTLADPVGDVNGGADITALDFESGDDGFLTFRVSLTAPLAPAQGVELDVDTIDGGGGFLGLPGGLGYDFGVSYKGSSCGGYSYAGGAGGTTSAPLPSLTCQQDGNAVVLRVAAADISAGATMRLIASTTHFVGNGRFFDDHVPDCGAWTVSLGGPADPDPCAPQAPPPPPAPTPPLIATFHDTLSKAKPKRIHTIVLPDDAVAATLTAAWTSRTARIDLLGVSQPDADLTISKTRTTHSVRDQIDGLGPGPLTFKLVATRLHGPTRVQTRLVVERVPPG